MIQIYSQEIIMEAMPEEKWYISKDTFRGITFDIKKLSSGGVSVKLSGTSSVSSETYVNLTWPLQLSDVGDFVRMETSQKSNATVYYGLSYVRSGRTENAYFDSGESSHDFYLPSGITDIRAVAYVKGRESVNTTVNVNLYFGRRPPETEEDYFSRNGDIALFATGATVHAVLNGSWTAELNHPIDPEGRWKYITEEAVVKMPSFNGDQLFRIKAVEKQDSGVAAIMEPIFYDAMNDCFLEDIRPNGDNGQEALTKMLSPNNKYSASSNITKTATAYYQYVNFLEALNGDIDQSFIKRWGGEILFDNYTVIVNSHVGGDYGAELRYGKNIPKNGMTFEVDNRDVVTRIYPKAYEGRMMSDNGYVDSPLINNYPTVKAATMTFENVKLSSDLQGDPEDTDIICDSQAELDQALTELCEAQFSEGLDKPKVTISVDMVLLQNTEQYKDVKDLEKVSLGDTVRIYNRHLGIMSEARVVELEYDAIRKKVSSVVIGDYKYNYFNDVSSAIEIIKNVVNPDGTLMAERVQGILNGVYTQLRLQSTAAQKVDGVAFKVEELDDESPLYGCMIWGTQGIQISTTRTADGKDWDWTTAITAKGIVANAIITGLLSDKTGRNYWDLDTGDLRLTGRFRSENQNAWGTEYVEIKDAIISGGIDSMQHGMIDLAAQYVDGKNHAVFACPNGTVHIQGEKILLEGEVSASNGFTGDVPVGDHYTLHIEGGIITGWS